MSALFSHESIGWQLLRQKCTESAPLEKDFVLPAAFQQDVLDELLNKLHIKLLSSTTKACHNTK